MEAILAIPSLLYQASESGIALSHGLKYSHCVRGKAFEIGSESNQLLESAFRKATLIHLEAVDYGPDNHVRVNIDFRKEGGDFWKERFYVSLVGMIFSTGGKMA